MCHISVSVAVAGDVHRHTIGGTSTNNGGRTSALTEETVMWQYSSAGSQSHFQLPEKREVVAAFNMKFELWKC